MCEDATSRRGRVLTDERDGGLLAAVPRLFECGGGGQGQTSILSEPFFEVAAAAFGGGPGQEGERISLRLLELNEEHFGSVKILEPAEVFARIGLDKTSGGDATPLCVAL